MPAPQPERDPDITADEAMLDARFAVSPGGLVHARPAEPLLLLHARDPQRFIVTTPWHEYSGDLSQGLVLQAVRGADGSPGTPVCHSGNIFEYRRRGRIVSLDVEEHIVDWGILRQPGRAVLFHESAFEGVQGPLGRRGRLARLRYEYTIADDSPVLTLTVTLVQEPGIALTRPCITTALDAMSPEEAPRAVRRVVLHGFDDRRAVATKAGASQLALLDGPARGLTFREQPVDGRARGEQSCHLALGDGHLLVSAKARTRQDGALHWAVLRYGGRTLPAGGRLVVREERLRLAGDAAPATEAPATVLASERAPSAR